MKLKLFKSLIMLFLLSFSLSLTAQTTLYVMDTSGNQTTYPLSNVEKLTFNSGFIIVHPNTTGSQYWSMDFVRYLSFDNYVSNEDVIIDKEELSLYPNPVNNKFTVKLESDKRKFADIQIISATGEVVMQSQEVLNKGNNNFSLDISGLNSGIYICRMKDEDNSRYVKFIKR